MTAKAVKHRAVKHRAVKHDAKQEAVMKQIIQKIGPNTRLAQLTMANWKAEKTAGLVKPTAVGDAGIVKIPLEQLDDSPYQLRHDMDQDELAELTRSIRDRGLLNPILVRRGEKMYEVISGNRRLGAYRRLQFAAKTDAERQKYDAIPARVLDVTDDQVLLFGIAENMFRAEISPLDAALGLGTLQKLKPALSSEETRKLDLMSALQFTRLHQALSKKGGKTKDGKSTADAQTGAAITRALKEDWGLRDVTLYVSKAIAKLAAPDNKRKNRGRPAAPFKKNARQLVIYYSQLDTISDIQRQSLLKALEEIIQKLNQRPKSTALSNRTP